MAMENERVELHQLQIADYDKLPEIFENFAGTIEEIGMNPFKGM
jgi:coenzyme F420-reducing hydrogenase delta subunit